MTSINKNASAQEAREMYEMKKQAIQYYAENGVPQKMEEILNSTFYDKPQDVYGHLASYFDGFSETPTITKVLAWEALDSKGQSAIQTEIYCMIKNCVKLVSTTLTSNESYPPDSIKPEEREAIEMARQKSITEAIQLINSRFNDSLKNLDPTKQQEFDTVLMNTLNKLEEDLAEQLAKEQEEKGEEETPTDQAPSQSPRVTESKTKPKSPKVKNKGSVVVIVPDEPLEKFFCGCEAIASLSQAASAAGASLKGDQLYQHIAATRYDEVPDSFSVPLPMVTIMMSGKLSPGKLSSVKEYMVVPKPGMPLKESIKHIVSIYNHCAKILSAKTGVIGKATNELGALWATFDRAEQGIDLLQEAITHLELTPGEDFHIALNCAGHEIFDYEKGKYEVVTGQQKTSDDLVEYWADLKTKYPSIIALIDPMRKQEQEAWMKLCERISENCYIIGDAVYHRPGLLQDEDLSPDFKTSGAVFYMEKMNTITDIIAACKKMEDIDNQTVISAGTGESTDTFLADLAVGCGARFLKIGAPCRGERVMKLNRLLQIETTLASTDNLKAFEPHVFTLLKPPTPPPVEPEGEGDAEDTGAKKD